MAVITHHRTTSTCCLFVFALVCLARDVGAFVPSPSGKKRKQRKGIQNGNADASGRIVPVGPLAATEGENDESELILDGSVGESGDSNDFLSDYRAAAAKRNEEAKRKLMERVAQEEEAAQARAKAREEGAADGPKESNYGPGDLSTLPSVLTNDESWESSLGDDDSGLMGGEVAGATGGEGAGDDGPGLYIPSDDNDEPSLFIPTEGGEGDGDSPILL